MATNNDYLQRPVLGPGVTAEMLQADFWIGRTEKAEETILTSEEITDLNQKTFQRMKDKGWQEALCDLEEYPSSLSREELLKVISTYSGKEAFPDKPRYNGSGRQIATAEKEEILNRANYTGIPEEVKVQFGILIERQNLRAFPTDTVFAPSPEEIDMDYFQLTTLPANSPVVVLHSSSDGNWVYIQSTIYRGWVRKKSIALANNRSEIFDFLKTERFLIVTGSRLETEPNPFLPEISNIEYQMGDILPLVTEEEIPGSLPPDNQQAQSAEGCYLIKVPTRDEQGRLKIQPALLARSNELHQGYLLYSRTNLLKQAFKMLGERYGWGGLFNRRDCSRFVLDIYRTVGIILPRDTGIQEEGAAGESIKFSGSLSERKEILNSLEAGDPLYLKGHTMIYLGKVNDGHYVIHAGSGYGVKDNSDQLKPVTVHGVFVMELTQLLKSGNKTYLEALTTGRKFK